MSEPNIANIYSYSQIFETVLQDTTFEVRGRVKAQQSGNGYILDIYIPTYSPGGELLGTLGVQIKTDLKEGACFIPSSFNKGRVPLPEKLGPGYLTRKEVLVLKHLLLGKTAKEIAKFLNLSFRTIEDYVVKIKRKLNCTHKNQIPAVVSDNQLTQLFA